MKKYLFIGLCIVLTFNTKCANAQNMEPIIKTVKLNEVVVNAKTVIRKPDKSVLFPTSEQRKIAKNGLSLIGNMQLNGIQVNTIFNTVSASGGGQIIFKINDREVPLNEIVSLKSEDIFKIEFDENPGLRYKDAQAVISIVLKAPKQGGGVFADLMEAYNTVYGVNTVAGKYNYGNSEWSANYYIRHMSMDKYYNMNDEKFIFGDNTITQNEIGIPTRFISYNQFITLNYNYLLPKKWMLNIAFKGNYYSNPKGDLNSRLTNSEYNLNDLFLYNKISEYSNASSLDVYLQKNISKNRLFLLNLVGTYTNTHNNMNYNITNDNQPFIEIENRVRGEKRSVIGEAIYEQMIGENKWTTGVKSIYGKAKNNYYNSEDTHTNLTQNDTYFYSEWSQKLSKLMLSLGAGGKYVSFKQGDIDYNKIFFTPMLRLSYSPSSSFSILYRGSIDTQSPSLSELSNVEQKIGNYQIVKGNPELKTALDYKSSINLNLHKQWFSTGVNANYCYRNNPVMQTTTATDNHIYRIYENQDSWQKLNVEYEMKFKILYGLISFRGAVGWDYYNSKGLDYSHVLTNWYKVINAQIAYKFIALTFNMTTHRPILYGERIDLGEDLQDISLTYFKNRFNISFAFNNPFYNNYKIGSENLSKLAPHRDYRYVDNTSKLCLVKVVYGFDFGRKHKTELQRLSNEDKDTGVMKEW